MAVLGKAVAESDAEATLLGVAPARLVTFPNDTRGLPTATTPLDPNHSCFVLANSDEWGGETPLLFDLLDALGDAQPRVAVLAGGGAATREEVRDAIERGMPVVVSEGTGGLADELARASRSKADEVRTDPAGVIAREADIVIVPLDADPSDVERLLTRHLKVDETLRDAWAQQELLSEAASRHRADFGRLQGAILTLGFTVTLLVVAQTVLEGAGYFDRVPWLEAALYLSILTIPITVTFLTGASGRFRPGSRWLLLRGASETIKREIFRYRVRAGIYSHANTRETPREVKLAQAVGSAIGGLMRTDVSQAAFDPEDIQRRRREAAARKRNEEATAGAHAVAADQEQRERRKPDNRLAPLTPAGYVEHRISSQIEYYLRTARKQERQARWLRVLALAFGGIGTLLAALGLQIYVAATTSLIAVYTTLVESRQLETAVTFYNQAAADLSSIRAWWHALPPSQQDTQETIDRLVERAERIMRAEHIGWVQEMQDAMTQFRIEQATEGGEPSGAGSAHELPSGEDPTLAEAARAERRRSEPRRPAESGDDTDGAASDDEATMSAGSSG
jgi:SLOG in TRPM, prokaryote/SMODS and SLOG-associating 2TM effector domain 1/Protein of unknown function (DUF4231)